MKRNSKVVGNDYILGFGGVAKGIDTILGTYGILSLRNTKERAGIGTPIKDEDCVGVETRIWFSDADSVNALIQDLKELRRDMLKAQRKQCIEIIRGKKHAANIKSLGDTNKLGQVPGAGKKQRMHNAGKNKRSRSSRAGK